GMPPGSAGFVDVHTALPLALGAMLAVPMGARVNQRIGRTALRRIFGVSFLLLGARLVMVTLPLGH
ncbi:MAG TPA: TSUP family transporter, partial [Xanthomonadaceae bacterium]|nr:TSUP family transporter [Xanthomonadaceae bacterium]